MGLGDIKLFNTNHAPTQNKGGNSLTTDEMDNNFVELVDAVSALSNTAVISDYDPDVTYSSGQGVDSLVRYNGTIYKFVHVVPQAGVTPGTNDAVWNLTSPTELAHVQNTDTKLAEGEVTEVTAEELRTTVDLITSGTKDTSLVTNEKSTRSYERRPVLPAFSTFQDATSSGAPYSPPGTIFILSDGFSEVYTIDTIEWQSSNTVRYTFDNPANMAIFGAVGDTAKFFGCTNPKHDGRFVITGFDSGSGWIQISNPLISNASDDESSSPGSCYITSIDFDGASVNDWVRLSQGVWGYIEPQEGQTSTNVLNQQTYVFKNDAWTSQLYVLPEQPKPIQLLYNGLLDVNVTTDQTLTLTGEPGMSGFTKFYITDFLITNTETTIGTLDDLQVWSGATRTGDQFFSANNAALLNLTINTGYISSIEGSVIRVDKKLTGTSIKASFGVTNGSATSIRVRIFGYPIL